ncbi:hypothetical protein LCGC14_1584710 [marine sediment metagenome]|uniref:Uncharacterized protein n=1 Tax=marine sediment metagenome TaxID=412755 RepID=A0A0F9LG34_9ZZZZ
MTDLRGRAGQTGPRRVSDGQPVDLRATRDGTPFTAEWYTALALEGKCFIVNHGVASTAVACNTAWLETEPDVYIYVPDNIVVLPVSIYLAIEDTVAAAATIDVNAVASSVGDDTVSGSALTVMNIRTDAPESSSVTATGTVTGTSASTPYAGNYYEFWRPITGAVINNAAAGAGGYNYAFQWSALEEGIPPMVVGTGSLSLYCGALTASQALIYSGVTWAELPESAIA